MEIPKVKITCEDGITAKAHIMVGDKELRITKAVITMVAGEYVKLKLETYAELVDVDVLQKNTKLIIRNLPKGK